MNSTSTVRDRAYWTSVIHHAASVHSGQPRYEEARQVIQMALDNLDSRMGQLNAADQPKPVVPGKAMGAAMNAFEGLTLGFGDEALGGLAGLGTLLTGGSAQQASNRVQQTQQGFLDQRANFYGQHPAISIGSDLYGTLANPLNKILGPVTEGLGPVAKAAVYGTTLGGARGFGEARGSAKERLPAAATGAVVGLLVGSVLGKAVKIVGPTVSKMVQNAQKILGPSAAPAEVANVVEASIRARLAKLNVAPEDAERAIQSWRETGELSVRRIAAGPQPPPPPPTIRPGETLTQISPRGFEVTGTRATPPVPTTPTIAEILGGRATGILPSTVPDLTNPQVAAAQRLFAQRTGITAAEAGVAPGTPVMPPTLPQDRSAAARAAYHLSQAAGQDATKAAARAAGTYSTFDPRQALLLALLLGQQTSRGRP